MAMIIPPRVVKITCDFCLEVKSVSIPEDMPIGEFKLPTDIRQVTSCKAYYPDEGRTRTLATETWHCCKTCAARATIEWLVEIWAQHGEFPDGDDTGRLCRAIDTWVRG